MNFGLRLSESKFGSYLCIFATTGINLEIFCAVQVLKIHENRAKVKFKTVNRTSIFCRWPEILPFEKMYFSAGVCTTFAAHCTSVTGKRN